MNNDIFLSSRIRLARNIDGLPFVLKDERALEIADEVFYILNKSEHFDMIKMHSCDDLFSNSLVEQHLISKDLISNKNHSALIVDQSSQVSIMINEEDHIRQQCIKKGLSLKSAYQRIKAVDNILSNQIPFAYCQRLGFLTSCLTNLGTGLRASVMMFLPALSLSKSPLVSPKALADEALTIRGVYGEGSDTQGFVYQISNKYSLGFSECEIIDGVELSASELGAEEIKARDLLFKTHYNFLMDNILRSFGTLLNCFSIEYLEFLRHIGFIKLGIYYGILGCRDCSMLEELVLNAGPSHLSMKNGNIGQVKRDVLRAEYAGEVLKNLIFRI